MAWHGSHASMTARFDHTRRIEVHGMRSFVKPGSFLIFSLFFASVPAFAQNPDDELFRPWIDYRDGAVSVTFTQVPVEFAVNAIQARTGFQIVVPRQAYGRTLNLRLRELPLESAMRSLIFSIGFTSYAFTYDRSGRPIRAIILEARPVDTHQSMAEPQSLTAAEKDELRAALKSWNDLNDDARARIETRLRSLPPSDDREDMLKEYGRRVLGIKD
jgi:hypothetical protein